MKILSQRNTQKDDMRFFIVVLGLYFIAFILLLLNKNALYWDDYTLYNHVPEHIMKEFCDSGLPLFGYIHIFMGSLGNGILPYRIAVFMVYLLSGLFLYYILCGLKRFSKNTAGIITLFFLILPVNNARISLIDFPYGLCLCLFFMAFWLLTKYLKKPTLYVRVFILALFFCSFWTNSLLVFYAIPLLSICYYHLFEISHDSISVHRTTWPVYCSKSLRILFLQYTDFVALPLIFFILRVAYYMPHGELAGYNTIVFQKVVYNILYSIKSAICKPLVDLIIVAGSHKLSLFLVVLFVLCLNFIKIVQVPQKQIWLCLGLGFIFWILAIFPYAAVNKIPDPGSFESRHMLLTPLGLSLIIYAFFLILAKIDTDVATGMCIVFVAACVFKNGYDQAFFLKDWFYQVSLEENYRSNAFIRDNATFVFHSDIAWANRRTINFCEHTVRLLNVFGNQKRLMAPNEEALTLIRQGVYKMNRSLCFFEAWKYSEPKHIYAIRTPIVFNEPRFLKMLVLMYRDDQLFRTEARKLLHVTQG